MEPYKPCLCGYNFIRPTTKGHLRVSSRPVEIHHFLLVPSNNKMDALPSCLQTFTRISLVEIFPLYVYGLVQAHLIITLLDLMSNLQLHACFTYYIAY